MPILCPPKNEAWKSLVDSLGDERHAYVAFFRNGDKLPDLATATKLLGPIPEKPSSSAIKDLDTGEVWSGEPTHGLLHDKIPNMNSRRLEAGFMTNRGNYWTQAQAESATGFSSGEELFVMSDKQRKAWRKTQAEVAAADQPQPVQPKTVQSPIEVLSTANQVHIKAPRGATAIRATLPDGRSTVVYLQGDQSINKGGNTLKFEAGEKWAKIEAGTIASSGTAKGRFKKLEGDLADQVTVEDRSKSNENDKKPTNEVAGRTIQGGGDGQRRLPAANPAGEVGGLVVEPAANLGAGLKTGEGMSVGEVRSAISGQNTAGFGVEVISKDDAVKLTGRNEAAGYGGFFYNGKIYLVADNVAPRRINELHQLLREEVGHGLLRTSEGTRQLQAVLDAGKLNLTDAEKSALRAKGYQEHQLLDEFIAKSAAENRPWWTKAVDQVRVWLSKVGLANLTNDEVARLLIKNIRRATSGVEDFSNAIGLPRIAANYEQVDSPNFKKWFGDSKVVDDKGNPLVVFHGTAGDFYEFNKGIAFFTPSRAAAADYMERSIFSQHDVELPQDVNSVDELGRVGIQQIADEEGIDLTKGKIVPTFLSIKKPLDLTRLGPNFDPKYDWDELHKLGIVEEKWGSLDEDAKMEVQDEFGDKAIWNFLDSEGHDKIQKLGYDGVIFDDVDMAGKTHTSYAVFEPTQIKSATDNVGAFDATNPDIRAGEPIPPEGADETPTNPDDLLVRQIGSKKYTMPGPATFPKGGLAKANLEVEAFLRKIGIPFTPADAENQLNVGRLDLSQSFGQGEYDAEGRALLKELIRTIETPKENPEQMAYAGQLARFVNYNVDPQGGWFKLMNRDTANQIIGVSANVGSEAGTMLRAIRGIPHDLLSVAANLPVFLQKIYQKAFNGDAVDSFVRKVLTALGKDFTDADLNEIANSHPAQEKLVKEIMDANAKDSGGQVYRLVQQALKPKNAKKLSEMERNAKNREAANAILAQAADKGILPKERPGKKDLNPVEKLLLVIKDKQKVNDLVIAAVREAELKAGKKSALNDLPLHMRDELIARFLAGEEPEPGQIEVGLNLPLFAHWRVIRDNLRDYMPVTQKLASKVVPKISDLARKILETPAYLQWKMRDQFIQSLVDEHNLSEEQGKQVAQALIDTYGQKFKEAREKAQAMAEKKLTPQERTQLGFGTDGKMWKAINEFFNAGGSDSAELLRKIASKKGYSSPTDEQVSRMQLLTTQIQRWSRPTDAAEAAIRDNPNLSNEQKAAQLQKASEDRKIVNNADIRKAIEEIARMWSGFTKPLNMQHWGNIANAAYEYTTSNILSTLGFPIRLGIHVTTQAGVRSLVRPIGAAIQEAKYRGSFDGIWKDLFSSYRDALEENLKSLTSAGRAFRAQLKGRGEILKYDRMMNGINALARMAKQADEYWKKGNYVRGSLLHFMASIRYSQHIVAAWDAFQGEFVENQEMLNQVRLNLAAQGKTRAQIELMAPEVMQVLHGERLMALADARRLFDEADADPTTLPQDFQAASKLWSSGQRDRAIAEAADRILKNRAYWKMQELGIPKDDERGYIYRQRMAEAWQEPTQYGLGGAVTKIFGGVRRLGVPILPVQFGNAIGAGINYHLRLLPYPFFKLADVGAVRGGGKPGLSAWVERPVDMTTRQVRSVAGLLVGGTVASLILYRHAKVNLAYPQDKKKREEFIAQGHRPMTIEFPLADGSFTSYSLLVGPFSVIAPYAAAAGAVVNLQDRQQSEQDRLNAEAAKLGVTPGKAKPIDLGDVMGVAGEAAWTTLLGGSTASGLIGGYTQFGIPNANRAAASLISPFIPGLRAYQEVSRMMGISLDKNTATALDYLVPLPGSKARLVNSLGDPVETPNDVQRVIQSITAGTYPLPIKPGEQARNADDSAAYLAMASSGFHAPSIDPRKGYNINGEIRPMTASELEQYTVLRGQYLKANLSQLGATATPQQAKAAYQQANAQALAAVGVQTAAKTPTAASRALPGVRSAIGRVSASRRRTAKIRYPKIGRISGRRISALRHRRTSLYAGRKKHRVFA
jgi:hypothetical protein